MANNIAAETPCENDGILWCTIDLESVNPTTGVIESAPVVGAVDVEAFFSATKELDGSVALGTLTFPLANVTGTNVYFSYYDGADLSADLLPTYKDTKVYVHFLRTGGGYHVVAETVITNDRAA